jgi:hypothetical protein
MSRADILPDGEILSGLRGEIWEIIMRNYVNEAGENEEFRWTEELRKAQDAEKTEEWVNPLSSVGRDDSSVSDYARL